ncbi:AAA family ATPase [Pseudoalteromonas arctica]|uniref:AAA family ATPase n=2 Tax=Gammaproteobacteria TaxID=1236 RepID=A0ABU9TLU7_9GAMM
MAKKGTNRRNSPAIPVAEKPNSATSSSVLNNMFKKIGVTTEEKLVSKLNVDEREKLSELTLKLQQLIDENETIKKTQDQSKFEIEERMEKLNTEENEYKEKLSSVNEKEKSLSSKESSVLTKLEQLAKKEKVLFEQEANAKAGFAIERQEALESLKEEYQKVEQKISSLDEQRRADELKMIEENARRQVLIKEEEKAHFSAIRESIENEKSILKKKQIQFDKKASENKLLSEQLKSKLESQDSWKQQVYEDCQKEFQSVKASLENELKNLDVYRKRDEQKIKDLTDRLQSYKELEREARIQELGSPVAVLERMDELEKELKDTRNKLKGRSEDDLEEELDYYKEKAEELEEELRELKQSYQEVKGRESKYKLSMLEKLELQKHKDLLEASNAALTHSIEAIRAQLDDLIEKQQSQETFKELTLMDRKHSEPVAAQPINSLKEFTEDLQHRIATSTDVELYYDLEVIRKFIAGLALSPLHVFQGISGTGKTSLVNAFAKAVGGQVTPVPVQAGWRDRDDLIGHYNAFEKRYYEKECLQAIYRAHTPSFSNRFNIVLLDEMNLSRPEQYFAEFLSAMEQNELERKVVLMDSSVVNPPKHFVEDRKVLLKPNTWFMGTANHDETTFEFADKTHDRAFTLDLEKQEKPLHWRAKASKHTVIDFNSVTDLFVKAQHTHQQLIQGILQKLLKSNFTMILEGQFDIGWGNRLESQALRFISVYKDCGGQAPDALEHMLITRVLRKGKVLGRYDISIEKLEELKAGYKELFKSINGDGTKGEKIIEAEVLRKKEGVY